MTAIEESNAVQLTGDETSDKMPSLGTIEGVYTYGAPATAQPPLENLMSEDRCFGGLRSYNEDVIGPATKQVDAAAMSNFYPHARIPTAVLHKTGDSIYVPCPSKEVAAAETWPNDNSGEVFSEWGLHWENDYTPRLKNIKVKGEDLGGKQPFLKAYDYVIFAYKTYDSTIHAVEQVHNRLPTWKLVARETRVSGKGTSYDEDPILLFQDSKTLDCAITFTGTNNVDNELSTSTTSYGTGYCGFDQVHVGYRNELWSITKDLWPKLRPKLSKCNKVDCVGHSLGGSLCEIFAACANSKRVDNSDYQQQMWARQEPALIPEIKKGGVVMVADAEKRCEEPPCPKTR